MGERILTQPHDATMPRTATEAARADAGERPPRRLSATDLAEAGLLVDVAVILDLASIYLPLLGPALGPAVPAPFAVLYLRRGARPALLATVVAAFLVTVLSGPHFGWRMGLQALVGLLLGWAMRRRLHPGAIVTLATVLVSTVSFLAALGLIAVVGLPVERLVEGLRNGMAAVAWTVASGVGLLGGEQLWLAVRPALVTVAALGLRFWPALLYLNVALFAAPTVVLYYSVANLAARVLGYPVRPFPPRWIFLLTRAFILVAAAPLLVPLWLWTLLRPRRLRSGKAATP